VIKAKIDRPQLEKSLKKFAKLFGETSAQAVVRWSVQTCRELAMETQAWGKVQTKKKQEGAILADAYNVLLVVDTLKSTGKGYRVTNQGKSYSVAASKVLKSPGEISDWIEIHRTRRRGRTARIPIEERKVVSRKDFKAGMKERIARSGMAKGAWLGAGQAIARAQTGQEKINIGKNFLGYAQKHSGRGTATKPTNGWRPICGLTNHTAHSASKNVLSDAGMRRSVDFGLRKTVKWYEKAVKALDKKSA